MNFKGGSSELAWKIHDGFRGPGGSVFLPYQPYLTSSIRGQMASWNYSEFTHNTDRKSEGLLLTTQQGNLGV